MIDEKPRTKWPWINRAAAELDTSYSTLYRALERLWDHPDLCEGYAKLVVFYAQEVAVQAAGAGADCNTPAPAAPIGSTLCTSSLTPQPMSDRNEPAPGDPSALKPARARRFDESRA